MVLKIPKELTTYFKGATRTTIPYNEYFRAVLAGMINENLSLDQRDTTTEDNYDHLADRINDWRRKLVLHKRYDLKSSYLRNIVNPQATSERSRWSKERVLSIYLALEEFRKEEEESLPFLENMEAVEESYIGEIRQKLLEGSKRFYLELCNAGIVSEGSEIILPKLRLKGTIIEEEVPLQRVLKNCWVEGDIRSFMLVGDGGAGKSTMLSHLWKLLLNQERIVPIYIPMREKEFWQDKKEFIFWYIVRNYLSKHQVDMPQMNDLWDFLQSNLLGKVPRMLLMLDGLNELHVGTEDVFVELDHWRRKGVSFQAVVSSRTDSRRNHICFKEFELLAVEPLRKEQVDQFIQHQNVLTEVPDRIKKILANPLMLSLYTRTYQSLDGHSEHLGLKLKFPVKFQSDVLWNFLQIQLLRFSYTNHEFYRVKFMLFHFFPVIAYQSFIEEKQIMSRMDLERYARDCGMQVHQSSFREAFPEYFDHFHKFGLEKPTELYVELKKLLSETFALLKQKDEGFQFFHQSFRDFLAGLHVVNTLRHFLYNRTRNVEEDFPSEIKKFLWPTILKRSIWEISYEDEFHNPLMEQILACSRGIFDSDKIGRTNINVINILSSSLKDLADVDMSHLYLMNISFNGTKFYRRIEDKIISNSFEGSLFDVGAFGPPPQMGRIHGMSYNSTGNLLVIGTSNGVVNIWNMRMNVVEYSILHKETVWRVAFHPSGKYILFLDGKEKLIEYNLETKQVVLNLNISPLKCPPWECFIGYSRDGERIGFCNFEKEYINVFDRSGKYIITIKEFDDFLYPFHSLNGEFITQGDVETSIAITGPSEDDFKVITNIESPDDIDTLAISPAGRTLAIAYRNSIQEWDIESNECVLLIKQNSMWVQNGIYSPCGNKLVISVDNVIQEWDTITGTLIQEFKDIEGEVWSVNYSTDGKEIITVNKNGKIKLWHTEKGECTFEYEFKGAQSAFFSDQGLTIEFMYNEDLYWHIYETKEEYSVEREKGLHQVSFSEKMDKMISIDGMTIKNFVGQMRKNSIYCTDDVKTCFFLAKSPDGKKVASELEYNIFAEWDVESGNLIRKYIYFPGMYVSGCSFQNLHSESIVTETRKGYLASYGAKF